jgi:hypothetical protein
VIDQGDSGPRTPIAKHAWILVPILAFFVYAVSFNSFPAIERQKGLLGDAGNFKILIERWSLGTKLGNEYATSPRTLEDVAQKHKVHHALFGIVGRPVYLLAKPVYAAAGWDPGKAVYAVNALIGALTLVLLYGFLRQVNRFGNPLIPFVALYAFSLSAWLWGSAPGSWPLSGAGTLLILYLSSRRALPPAVLAAMLGVFMLNNMTLGVLVIALGVPILAEERPLLGRLARWASLGLIAGGVWLGLLLLLSRFDDSFRPDRLIAYSAWFKQYLGETAPLTSLYPWKSILSNMFLTAFTSNQPNPRIPPEAVLFTLRGGGIGAVATLAVVALLVAGFWSGGRMVREQARQAGWRRVLQEEPSIPLVVHLAVLVGVTAALSYTSGLWYAPTYLPLVVILLCRYLDLRERRWQILTYGTIALVIINNAVQIDRFRDALRVMP